MTIEDKIKNLKKENLLMKIMLMLVVLTLGLIAVNETYVNNKIIAKTAAIASKVDVECTTKTNVLFGIFHKIKIVK